MVVMDQYTRRIIGFAVHAGTVDGRSIAAVYFNYRLPLEVGIRQGQVKS